MIQHVVDDSFINIDSCNFIHDFAIIGCLPERKIKNLNLRIGKNAHIRSGTVIYAGSTIGKYLSTGHNAIIREESTIGDYFSIWSNSTLDYGCIVGNRVKIHHNVYVAQFTELENDVFLGPGVTITNDPHPGCQYSKQCMRGPVIKEGAQIGANATILPFLTIGQGALVGAGSVVTKDVKPWTVVCGNPAKECGQTHSLTCTAKPKITNTPYPE